MSVDKAKKIITSTYQPYSTKKYLINERLGEILWEKLTDKKFSTS
jgi:hypothetical protein